MLLEKLVAAAWKDLFKAGILSTLIQSLICCSKDLIKDTSSFNEAYSTCCFGVYPALSPLQLFLENP